MPGTKCRQAASSDNHLENFSIIAYRVSAATIAVNILLAAVKLAAGLLAHSAAMVSDAIHTASDVVSTLVVMIGVRLSGRSADEDHPYGHDRLECVAALLLSGILLLTGLGICRDSLGKIMAGLAGAALPVPGALALAAALLSIIVKEAMYRYTLRHATMIASAALKADAWHHRSDAFSSAGTLLGIAGARLGLAILDPLAAGVICIMIIKVAYDIAKDAVAHLVDQACDRETVEKIRAAVAGIEGVMAIRKIYTRLFGPRFYVEIEVTANQEISLAASHRLARQVHDAVEAEFNNIKCCRVYVHPANAATGQALPGYHDQAPDQEPDQATGQAPDQATDQAPDQATA
jgi:cation diffusion facilitator family transporter